MSWKRCGTLRADEDRVARPDVAGLVAGREPAPAREHDVRLVLGVRLLAVHGARLEDVQPERQVGHAAGTRDTGRPPARAVEGPARVKTSMALP